MVNRGAHGVGWAEGRGASWVSDVVLLQLQRAAEPLLERVLWILHETPTWACAGHLLLAACAAGRRDWVALEAQARAAGDEARAMDRPEPDVAADADLAIEVAQAHGGLVHVERLRAIAAKLRA